MKSVGVARVKNELDIIEPFVRHHSEHFDKLIILDDGSTDGTYQALQQLQPACGNLIVLREPVIGYEQRRYMTLLSRMAVDKFGADWVVPLDADEFVEPVDGLSLADVLACLQPAIYELQWSNFIWRPELEHGDERNPVLRQRFRLPPHSQNSKLLIHSQFVNETLEISTGNHLLMDSGSPLPKQPLERATLCHYPIRSVAQYAGKIAVGYLQYLATPDWDRQQGFHYIEPFQELAKFGLEGVAKRIVRDSLFYSIAESDRAKDDPVAIEAPLNYLGGALTLTPRGDFVLQNVLRYVEMMAAEFVDKVERSRDFDRVSTENVLLRKRLAELEFEFLNSREKEIL
jgi:glycosyl transferase family 2